MAKIFSRGAVTLSPAFLSSLFCEAMLEKFSEGAV
jgi:hypothetical protein